MNSEDQPDETIFAEPAEPLAAGEVVLGQLIGLSPSGEALVTFAQNPSAHPLPAISTTAVTHQHIGRQTVLMFVDGHFGQPLIVGFVHSPLQELIESFELSTAHPQALTTPAPELRDAGAKAALDEVIVDGKKVVVEGQEEVVLRCGDASITLTSAGKILIRGKYLLNRSTGVNRILGGSVQVN